MLYKIVTYVVRRKNSPADRSNSSFIIPHLDETVLFEDVFYRAWNLDDAYDWHTSLSLLLKLGRNH